MQLAPLFLFLFQLERLGRVVRILLAVERIRTYIQSNLSIVDALGTINTLRFYVSVSDGSGMFVGRD